MPYSLPSTHRLAHDFALYLHDIIVALIRSGEASRIFHVRFDHNPGDRSEMDGLKGEALYKWIEDRKGPEVTLEMDYKGLIPALASDFCHFVLEGLRCASRSKLTVAYALFRKPLRDNLFYLEWLLTDPTDFLVRFRSGDPKQIDVGRVSTERKREIIAGAVQAGGALGIDPAKIYEVRFNRRSRTSLAGSWDLALHLVTTWEVSRTAPQNLNFIFSGPSQWESQWANIYWNVPFVLYHATFVVDALFETVGTADRTYRDAMELRRSIGYELWAEYARGDRRRGAYHPVLGSLLEGLPIACHACSEGLRHHRRALRRYMITGAFRCPACGSERVWPPEG